MSNKNPNKKILFFVANIKYFKTHRLNLALELIKQGYQIGLVTTSNESQKDILKELDLKNIRLFILPNFSRTRLQISRELKTLFFLYKAIHTFKPDVLHNVAMKPILYGSIIGTFLKIKKIVNAFGGLGFLFTKIPQLSTATKIKQAVLKTLAIVLFKLIHMNKNISILVQNNDDKNVLLHYGISKIERVAVINGVGINVADYPRLDQDANIPNKKIICAARILYSKGVMEFITAANIIKAKGYNAEFLLYGELDPDNPAAIKESEIKSWHKQGVINWQGASNNIIAIYNQAQIIVLPSYREGLPKSLLEAAAMAKAIITTDAPGCNLVVLHHKTGLLVPRYDAIALAQAIEELLNNPPLSFALGQAAYEFVQQQFNEATIINDTINLYNL